MLSVHRHPSFPSSVASAARVRLQERGGDVGGCVGARLSGGRRGDGDGDGERSLRCNAPWEEEEEEEERVHMQSGGADCCSCGGDAWHTRECVCVCPFARRVGGHRGTDRGRRMVAIQEAAMRPPQWMQLCVCGKIFLRETSDPGLNGIDTLDEIDNTPICCFYSKNDIQWHAHSDAAA